MNETASKEMTLFCTELLPGSCERGNARSADTHRLRTHKKWVQEGSGRRRSGREKIEGGRIVSALFHRDDGFSRLDQREVHDRSTRWNKRYPGGGGNQRKGVQLPRGCVIVVGIVECRCAARFGMSMEFKKVSVDDPRTGVNVLEWSHGKRHQQSKACPDACDGTRAR